MSRTLIPAPPSQPAVLSVLDDLRERLNSALCDCAEVSTLQDLESSIDNGAEFASILDLPDEAEQLAELHDDYQSPIQDMLVNLLQSYTVVLQQPKSFLDEYNSLTQSERSELYGLDYVKLIFSFA